MDYDAAVQDLFLRHRSVRDAGFSGEAYKPGLAAMLDYAGFMGHPERELRFIHVAGTNGKGSVCSMLAAALAACGLRVGLYTSPHLLDFRERIKIIEAQPGEPLRPGNRSRPWLREREGSNRKVGRDERSEVLPGEGALPAASMIPEAAVCEFLERYDRDGLSFFEVTTGMALRWFADEKVDVAVMETGLGGRLDSTNIITPELSVITSIGLDHCDLLGSTRADIASEKAGIFKPGVPALVWGRDPETQPVFERTAATIGAPLYYAEDFPLPAGKREYDNSLKDLAATLDLTGPCQDINLRTVLAALSLLLPRFLSAPDNQSLTDSPWRKNAPWTTDKVLETSHLEKTLLLLLLPAISHAASITGLRGRWETLLSNPQTICDIGHNPPAMEANCRKLEQLRAAPIIPDRSDTGVGGLFRRPLLVVYGAMKDKDVDDIKQFLPSDAEYFLVQPQTPRAMPLRDLALKLKHLRTTAGGSVAEGVAAALDKARGLPDAIVYIGGSTFVVSEAISYLESL